MSENKKKTDKDNREGIKDGFNHSFFGMRYSILLQNICIEGAIGYITSDGQLL